MARPKKCRRVSYFPESTRFIPVGKGKCNGEKVILKIEELEAIRLKDLEGLTQEECANKMNVSRQTFQNIIYDAHKKIAIALTEGKAIEISGGHYTTGYCKFNCTYCGETYEINYKQDREICPICGSKEVSCNRKNNKCNNWCENI